MNEKQFSFDGDPVQFIDDICSSLAEYCSEVILSIPSLFGQESKSVKIEIGQIVGSNDFYDAVQIDERGIPGIGQFTGNKFMSIDTLRNEKKINYLVYLSEKLKIHEEVVSKATDGSAESKAENPQYHEGKIESPQDPSLLEQSSNT